MASHRKCKRINGIIKLPTPNILALMFLQNLNLWCLKYIQIDNSQFGQSHLHIQVANGPFDGLMPISLTTTSPANLLEDLDLMLSKVHQ